MTGAMALAGSGCLRSGAGLVTLAVPEVCLETVAGFDPCYMTVPLPCDGQGRLAESAWDRIRELAEGVTAIACGPGLGRSDGLCRLVRQLFTSLQIPMVVDADALNALARIPQGLTDAGGPRVLTPHPGEFDRLTGSRAVSGETRRVTAHQWAERYGVVIVLKGHGTLVTDGQWQVRNETGNPGMATGGSGDVLTGVILALLCQSLSPRDAARLGVYAHGLAGDIAARQGSQVGMTASDLVEALPMAWAQLA
jgi:NAD(P)H-hydrate epimerase